MSLSERLRVTRRSIGLAGVILAGVPVHAWYLATRKPELEARLKWMQWMSCRFLRLLNCRVHVEGSIPRQGLIVSNHLSYLDILAIGSVCPAVFVAKSDVRQWPVFGWLSTMAGAIFIRRGMRMSVHGQLAAMARPLAAGFPVVLFPEGTSSDGSEVLRFRSSLLEAAHRTGRPIIPAAIHYDLQGNGCVATEVCYWGDMVFVSHLFNLLAKRSFGATVSFAAGRSPCADRKQEAESLRSQIAALRRPEGHAMPERPALTSAEP